MGPVFLSQQLDLETGASCADGTVSAQQKQAGLAKTKANPATIITFKHVLTGRNLTTIKGIVKRGEGLMYGGHKIHSSKTIHVNLRKQCLYASRFPQVTIIAKMRLLRYGFGDE